jgi:hypothetical protein
MSRFAQTYEDPEYEYTGEDEGDWSDIDTSPLASIVDAWVRQTVAEKQQEVFSPFQTSNS